MRPVDKSLMSSCMTGFYARFLVVVVSRGHGGASEVELSPLTRFCERAIGLHNSRTDARDEHPGTSWGADSLGGREQSNYRASLCHTIGLPNRGARKNFHQLPLELG